MFSCTSIFQLERLCILSAKYIFSFHFRLFFSLSDYPLSSLSLSLSLSFSMWSFNSFFILKFFSMLQLSRLFQAKAFGNHQKRGKVSRTNLLELSGYSSTPLWNSLWEKIKTSKKVVLRRKKPVPRKFFPVV